MTKKISQREAAALFNSLSAGVVPRIGLRHIAVGRKQEIGVLLRDLKIVQEGGATFRFICGRYGSGKSFLLQLIRNNAIERNFVVMDVDFSLERRLAGSKNQGLATYSALMESLSTRTRPDGRALDAILLKWLHEIDRDDQPQDDQISQSGQAPAGIDKKITSHLSSLTDMVCGYSFVKVISAYWHSIVSGDEQQRQSALRWLRGEYRTKLEARRDLAVYDVIDDQNWYEFLKIFALFSVKAGYKGLMVFFDEGVNLYKIPHRQSRENNYERILAMFNDTMQGKASHLGILMSGTPQFIDDERRGLASYEALRSRIADHRFAKDGFVDPLSPVLRIKQLTPEELYLLVERLRDLHASYFSYEPSLQHDQIVTFLNSVNARLGTDQLLTPREITRDFLGLLSYLSQNPDISFEEAMDGEVIVVQSALKDPEQIDEETERLFAEFDL